MVLTKQTNHIRCHLLYDFFPYVQPERANLISQLKPLTTEDKRYRMAIDEKRKGMKLLHAAFGKLRNANNAAREKGVGLCSSEEELNDLVCSS